MTKILNSFGFGIWYFGFVCYLVLGACDFMYTIGLDLDGVIIDHTKNKIKKAKELGHIIKAEEISSERLKKLIPPEDYRVIQKFIYNKGTPTAEPMKGALQAIKSLKENYHIVIISRRAEEMRKTALEWLKKHGFLNYIKRKDIYFADKDSDKNVVAKRLKVHIYIDDKLSVLESLKSVPNRILFDPYNCFQIKNKEIKKIESWQRFSASFKFILAVNS